MSARHGAGHVSMDAATGHQMCCSAVCGTRSSDGGTCQLPPRRAPELGMPVAWGTVKNLCTEGVPGWLALLKARWRHLSGIEHIALCWWRL